MRAEETHEDEAEDDISALHLAFTVEKTRYALHVGTVTEIVNVDRLLPMPSVAPWVRGVVNLRGNVIPVVDMRLRLGLSAVEMDRFTPAIIVELDAPDGDGRTEQNALLVDGVHGVTQIPTEIVGPPPGMPERKEEHGIVMGVARSEGDITVLVDPTELVFGGAEGAEEIRA